MADDDRFHWAHHAERDGYINGTRIDKNGIQNTTPSSLEPTNRPDRGQKIRFV